MTLIISCIARDGVIQVSDRRLVLGDGRVVDDGANKATCLWCNDGLLAFAYTGIARIGRERTDEWLAEALLAMKADRLSTSEVGGELRARLIAVFRDDPGLRGKPLEVVASGYVNGAPFWGNITNEEPSHPDRFGQEFLLGQFPPGNEPQNRAFLAVTGALPAVSSYIDRRIKKRQRRFFRQPPLQTMIQLANLVRATRKTPKWGNVVGSHCNGVVVLPNLRVQCIAFAEDGNLEHFLPNIVIGGIGVKKFRFEQDALITRQPDDEV